MSDLPLAVACDFGELEKRGAAFSPCRKYRYALHRRLPIAGPSKCCVFIMLNPSTADELIEDPTIRRCMGFARSWKCTDLFVGNLFAYRTPYPKALREHGVGGGDVVGIGNQDWLLSFADVAENREVEPGPIVCAWGPNGSYMRQDETVLGWLSGYDLYCLGRAKGGAPRHPLMLRKDALLERYTG